MRKGILFVISGPAGSGKGTVVKKILAKHPEIKLSISATTRSPRPEDKEGVTYFFISKDEFKRKIENDEFFEYNPDMLSIKEELYNKEYFKIENYTVDGKIEKHFII